MEPFAKSPLPTTSLSAPTHNNTMPIHISLLCTLCAVAASLSPFTTPTVPPVPTFPPPRFLHKRYEVVHGYRMAYVEVGTGHPIIFLHGNPTSSFIWRNIMPYLEHHGRLIAPDLIGMGDSDKLPSPNPHRYSFANHARFLYTLLQQLGARQHVTLVLHDWGSALGFTWAFLRRFDNSAVRAVAFMESITLPLITGYTEPDVIHRFDAFRSPLGEYLVLVQNQFVLGMDARGMLRNLSAVERAEYVRPFARPGEDRRPTLSWPREIPIDGRPADVARIVCSYSDWFGSSDIPKLFVRSSPGFFSADSFTRVIRSWRNLHEVVVPGIHFVQEDSPDAIGLAISNWLHHIPLQSA